MKKYICLALFLLPLLGMIAILMNYNSPVSSTIVNPDGTTSMASTIDGKNSNNSDNAGDDGSNGEDGEENNMKNGNIDSGNTGSGNDSSEWITRKVNNVTSSYKLDRDFSKCNVSKNVSDTLTEAKIVAPLAQINRIDFLEILLDTHCIDYSKADTSTLSFDDIGANDTKSKQIITSAIDLGIARGYDEGGRNVFKPNKKISKIEALAILMNLSGLTLKDKAPENNFADVEKNWKANVADTSYRLGLTPIDTAKNLFFPEYIMKKGDAYDMIGKVAKYY